MPESENQSQKHMGRHMMLAAWIIAIGLLSLFFSDVLDRQWNPNRNIESSISNQGLREIRLKRNRQGHYVARGRINDQSVTFLLDTGATVVSIPQDIARNLSLKAGTRSYANTANGVIETYSTRLDSIGIGNIELHDIAAHINPHMNTNEVLLGMSFLKRLELIQRGDTLTIRQ